MKQDIIVSVGVDEKDEQIIAHALYRYPSGYIFSSVLAEDGHPSFFAQVGKKLGADFGCRAVNNGISFSRRNAQINSLFEETRIKYYLGYNFIEECPEEGFPVPVLTRIGIEKPIDGARFGFFSSEFFRAVERESSIYCLDCFEEARKKRLEEDTFVLGYRFGYFPP